MQQTLLKPQHSKRDSLRLSRQLSRRYPGLPLDVALREENAKLRKELDHMKVSNLKFGEHRRRNLAVIVHPFEIQ